MLEALYCIVIAHNGLHLIWPTELVFHIGSMQCGQDVEGWLFVTNVLRGQLQEKNKLFECRKCNKKR
jgi:hypothetical protein